MKTVMLVLSLLFSALNASQEPQKPIVKTIRIIEIRSPRPRKRRIIKPLFLPIITKKDKE